MLVDGRALGSHLVRQILGWLVDQHRAFVSQLVSEVQLGRFALQVGVNIILRV